MERLPDTPPLKLDEDTTCDTEAHGLAVPRFATETPVDGELLPPRISGMPIPKITVLCAEPGMGKSRYLNAASRDADNAGFDTWFFSFAGESAADAATHMIRLSRELPRRLHGTGNALVCFDDVPAADEYEVARQAKAIRRLAQSGMQVMVSLRTEGEQLGEDLWDGSVLRAADLLYRPSSDTATMGRLWQRTHGIGVLIKSYQSDAVMGIVGSRIGSGYLAAIESLVSATLRQGLADEELMVRMALVLLGSGSFDELAYISRRCDGEMLGWLHERVPLFGIDLQRRAFCCAGISEDEVFSALVGKVHTLGLCPDKLLIRVCEVLVARGEGYRASLVCGLAQTEETMAEMIGRWSVVLCEAGVCAPVLRCTYKHEGSKSDEPLVADFGQMAARALSESRHGKGPGQKAARKPITINEACEAGIPQDIDARRALLIIQSRELMRTGKVSEGITHLMLNGDKDLSGWYDHIEARSLMIAGRFSRAYELLADAGETEGVHTLPEALVADDMLIAELMTGGVPDRVTWSAFLASQAFFARSDIGRLKCYSEELIPALSAVLGHGANREGISLLMTRADSSGDDALLAWASLMSAVCEQRAGATTHAHVRCRRAVTLAQAFGLGMVEVSASFVDAVLCELLGESESLVSYLKLSSTPMQLKRLTAVVMRAMGQEVPHGFERVETFFRSAYSRDYLWELSFVLTGCGDLSREVSRVMPSSWHEMHRVVHARQAEFFTGEAGARGLVPRDLAQAHPTLMIPGMEPGGAGVGPNAERVEGQGPTHVRITFFGGFGVSVAGEPVPDRQLWRRKAKLVIVTLALARTHQLRRTQVLEEVWHEPENPDNARRVYEAMSVIRKVLGDRSRGIDPIVLDRSVRTVGLDSLVVSCDIDDFEREARAALSSDGDDETILTHASVMSRIYQDGPDIPAKGLGTLAQTRRMEIETLYVDTSILASEAALRTGRPRMAIQFATQAHTVAGLREDAVRVLIDALGQSGRITEVTDVYRTYSRRLIDEQGIPPSASLRHAVERIIERGRPSGPQSVLYAEL